MKSDDIKLLAQLVGSTHSAMKQIDKDIVSSSANLHRTNWDPANILKQHIKSGGAEHAEPVQEVTYTDQLQQSPVSPYITDEPNMVVPVVRAHSGEVGQQLTRMEKSIELICTRLNQLVDNNKDIDKHIEKLLKNKVKQVTIKFDDTNPTE